MSANGVQVRAPGRSELLRTRYGEDLPLGDYVFSWRDGPHRHAIACPSWGHLREYVVKELLPLIPGALHYLPSLQRSWGRMLEPGETLAVKLGADCAIAFAHAFDGGAGAGDVAERDFLARAQIATSPRAVLLAVGWDARWPVLLCTRDDAAAFARRVQERAQRPFSTWKLFQVERVSARFTGTGLRAVLLERQGEDVIRIRSRRQRRQMD